MASGHRKASIVPTDSMAYTAANVKDIEANLGSNGYSKSKKFFSMSCLDDVFH